VSRTLPLLAGTDLAGFWHGDQRLGHASRYMMRQALPVKGPLREWKRNDYSGGGNSKGDWLVFNTLQIGRTTFIYSCRTMH
jgi:hypothetical protein